MWHFNLRKPQGMDLRQGPDRDITALRPAAARCGHRVAGLVYLEELPQLSQLQHLSQRRAVLVFVEGCPVHFPQAQGRQLH